MSSTENAAAAVLEEVRGLVPRLRENGVEAERQRRLPEENVELLDKAGVFRLAVPSRFGGLEVSGEEQVTVLSEIARGCSSTGWVAMIWAVSAWIVTQYPDAAQEEVFADGSVRVSTGFTPTGTVTATEGGYKLNGSWKWLSGSQSAQWLVLVAVEIGEDGTPAPYAALVRTSEVEIADDWHASSASATGSVTVAAKDVFVPARRVAHLGGLLTGTSGDRSNTGATGRNYGFIPYIVANATASYLGIARGAYELFLDRLPGRGITYTSWTDQSQSPLTHIQVGSAASKLAAAEALAARWVRVLQDRADAGEQPTQAERTGIRGEDSYAIELAKEAVDVLFSASGASVIHRDVPFQRFHRDIQGLSLHALFNINTNLEVYGRELVGLAPDTPFL